MEKGIVKNFSEALGFGFIERQDQPDIIFYRVDINVEGYKTLTVGDEVTFSVIKSYGLDMATDVTPTNQNTVKVDESWIERGLEVIRKFYKGRKVGE
jgi:CspA family cold shock protein